MQIDWGWGSDFEFTQQPCEREGWGRLNSDTLPTSHSMSFIKHTHAHAHKHMRAHGQKDGDWTVATICLTLSRLSQSTVTPAGADPSLLPLSTAYAKKICFTLVPLFGTFGISALLFCLLCSSLHHGLWIWSYLTSCSTLSGSGNVDSGLRSG